MGLPKLKTKISVADYLDGELISEVRHEYLDGEVFAMAGASERHHRISLNLAKRLDDHLERSKCQAFMAEMKLKADEKTFYYPDVFVSCDKDPQSEYFREEPVLIIEVVSASTRQIDKREKLRAYQAIPTVQEYVIVEQDKVLVELHRRLPDGRWLTHIYNKGDFDEIIEFRSVEMTVTLEEIYNRVKFD
ncbi:MAG: Uma2 family endonuclease [Acidobacteria bacterium]|nr:Uma2 family endonuclease [Acidobacteriota bacterium]MBK8149701.1 Uma2 family endonuclease [Acidobacteriota bacterium]MBK8809826.1 Uma2 family endonuclease [Acidobacteriota bacterium]